MILESDIIRTMEQTGMARIQAIRHLQQREAIAAYHRSAAGQRECAAREARRHMGC